MVRFGVPLNGFLWVRFLDGGFARKGYGVVRCGVVRFGVVR